MSAFSQTKLTVRSIVVEGNTRTDASTIRINSGLYVGKEITGFDVQRAIQNLWELKQWKDIKVIAKEIRSGGDVDILVKVVEYPRLDKLIYEGNDEYDKDDLDKELRFYPNMVITPYKLFLAEKKLKEFYEKEGYLLASFKIDTIGKPNNKIQVTIAVDEGPEVEIDRIRIFGAKILDPDDVEDAMEETSEESWFLGIGGDFEQKKYKDDLALITKFIQNNGFRNGGVLRDSIYYSNDREDMYIDIWISEGNQYFFGDLKFQGNEKFTDEDFTSQMEIRKGDPYSEDKFQQAKQKITELYYNIGHLFAQTTPSEEIVGKDTINITYKISEQNVVRINEIRIEGNTKTQEKVIRRDMRIFPTQKFSQQKIIRSVSDLMRLNYFESVVPDVKIIPNSQDEVDLLFSVKEKSTDQANASIGYSELDGLIGSVGLSFNNFSLSKPFQEGAGQQLALNAQFGGVQNVYSVSVTEPWLNDKPTLIGASFYYSRTRKQDTGSARFQYVPYNEDRQSVSLTLGRRLKWPDNYFRASATVQYTRSELRDVDQFYLDNYDYFRRANNQVLHSSRFALNLSRDSRNSAEFPTLGSQYTASAEWNFGDKSYMKSIVNSQVFYPISRSGLIFHTNIKMGLINRFGGSSLLLPNDLFHMGGSGLNYSTESLRGYEDRSVGDAEVISPSSSGNFVSLGGDAMFKIVNEIRFEIAPNPTIYGLFFFEGGNVWADLASMDMFTLKKSAGMGIRLFMPLVGIIGLDMGYGFDRYNSLFDFDRSPTWEFHFQFGRF